MSGQSAENDAWVDPSPGPCLTCGVTPHDPECFDPSRVIPPAKTP